MSLSSDDVRNLLARFDSGSLVEMTVRSGPDRLHVSRRAPARPSDAGPPRPGAVHRVTGEVPSPPSEGDITVRSPSIGVFRRSAPPGPPAVVDVGSPVTSTDPVGFVEVMDRVVPVPAGTSGTVGAVLADDGATVEFGEALVLVVRSGGERDVGHG
jgi:biotin carboxyl carrier protein